MRKPEVKRPLGRHRRRWEYNIKMDVKYNRRAAGFAWLRIGISDGLL